MNELSLFTGIGGGVLGSKLLGWKTIGYVEINEYCQKIIQQRIKDGILDDAPIFGDITSFIDQGYAAAYQGMVDVITGGFPCQPFSVAGKQEGEDDKRNLWPETIETIRIVEPRYVLLENVSNLLAFEYFGTILGELSESGYAARWKVISAAEVGAPHKRDRLWIVGYSHKLGLSGFDGRGTGKEPENRHSEVVDPNHNGLYQNGRHNETEQGPNKPENQVSENNGSLADTNNEGLERSETGGQERSRIGSDGCNSEADCRCRFTPWACCRPHEDERLARSGICRISHGIPNRVDRLKALGNAQVPAVVRAAWEILK